MEVGYVTIQDDLYMTVYPVGTKLQIGLIDTVCRKRSDEPLNVYFGYVNQDGYRSNIIFETPNGRYTVSDGVHSGYKEYELGESGTYILTYTVSVDANNVQNHNYTIIESVFTYIFEVVENKLPLKRLTITDVINRVLDLCEPIRMGEKPRFKLQGMYTEPRENDGRTELYAPDTQAAAFDKE